MEYTSIASGLTNLIHDRCSCTLFILSSVSSNACSRLAGCVHSSVNKPDANCGVSCDWLTHSRLYCRDREKKKVMIKASKLVARYSSKCIVYGKNSLMFVHNCAVVRCELARGAARQRMAPQRNATRRIRCE